MKKAFLLLAVLAMGAVTFSSCSEDELEMKPTNKVALPYSSDLMSVNSVAEILEGIKIHFYFFPNSYVIFTQMQTDSVQSTFARFNSEVGKPLNKRLSDRISAFEGSYEECCAWYKEELDKGKIVVAACGKKEEQYQGTSFTKEEWLAVYTGW